MCEHTFAYQFQGPGITHFIHHTSWITQLALDMYISRRAFIHSMEPRNYTNLSATLLFSLLTAPDHLQQSTVLLSLITIASRPAVVCRSSLNRDHEVQVNHGPWYKS